jgi:tol-pal system protein YbgF
MIGYRALKLPALCILLALTVPLHAAPNKEMIQLQTQVQELQDAIARLTQANDERLGVLKDLVQQNSDSVNKMALSLETFQKQLLATQSAQAAKADQLSGQVQSVNDSVDETKARLNSFQKTLQDIQNQLQSINANLQNLAPPPAITPATDPTAPTADTPSPAAPTPVPPAPATKKGKLGADNGGLVQIAPASDLYQGALNDWVSGKYSLAAIGFNDVVKNYPDDTLAGNAYYYLGEIEYRNGKYAAAIKDYDHVIDQYPDNQKIPPSHLHKGQALLALKQEDAGVREYRVLIQRFPNSNEAGTAKNRLNGMGIPVVPRH